MNRANLLPLGNKEATNRIARERSVNASSVNAKNKAVNRAGAISRGDDKPVPELKSGGRQLPPLLCTESSVL